MKYKLVCGDALKVLKRMPDRLIQCCVTSPPYFGLRDYGAQGQIGLESTPEKFTGRLVEVFREVKRVLCDDGTLWVNLGDSYAGSWGNQSRKKDRGTQRPINSPMIQSVNDGRYPDKGSKTGSLSRTPECKNKDLIGIPWMLAFALRADGWYLRQDIIWHKPNPMPESVRDRCTRAHEYIFMLSKSPKYFYDSAAVREKAVTGAWDAGRTPPIGGKKQTAGNDNDTYSGNRPALDGLRNRRDVWTVPTASYKKAHFAVFPPALIRPCILAGSTKGSIVLDPFNGAGTTGLVAMQEGRRYIGIDLNLRYIEMTEERFRSVLA